VLLLFQRLDAFLQEHLNRFIDHGAARDGSPLPTIGQFELIVRADQMMSLIIRHAGVAPANI
jgi:hypothetical protein